jgi:hypothetical protein
LQEEHPPDNHPPAATDPRIQIVAGLSSRLSRYNRYYYDTDHLNRAGTVAFIDGPFGALLASLPR